ncbi:hypothetical protein ACWKWU_18815 [Chitinophaga lutea]
MYIVFFVLLVALAAVPLTVTFVRWRRLQHIRSRGVRTSGFVVEVHTVPVKRGRPIDSLHVEFEGNYARVHAPVGKYKAGDKVRVYYLPEEPYNIVIEGGLGYGTLLVFFLLLFLFVCFAVYKLEEMVRLGV